MKIERKRDCTLFFFWVTCLLAQVSPTFAQWASVNNVPSKTTSAKPIASGVEVWGVFEGRCPCQDIAKQLNITVRPECTKIKWGLTLYQDPQTHEPTTYKLEGSFYRPTSREGKWVTQKGTPTNPEAIVFQLDPDQPANSFFFQKGDDNVLFVLDENRKFRIGSAQFSYTLNRVTN